MDLNYDVLKKEFKKLLDESIDYLRLKDKTILIAGGDGLIASIFVDYLMFLDELYFLDLKIIVLSLNLEKAKRRFRYYSDKKNISYLIQNVIDPIKHKEKIDYIIHAASNAHPLAYATDPIGTMKANILGVFNLAEYCVEKDVNRLLYISSSEVYGEQLTYEQKGIDENGWGKIDILNPRSSYTESKRASETICASYLSQLGLDFVVARPGYIYGPAITKDNSRADAQFLRNVLDKKDIVLKSDGSQLRSYCYVLDNAHAILVMLLNGQKGHAYNISNKYSNASIREYAEILADKGKVNLVFDIPDEIETKGYSKVKNSILNENKLISIGWEAKFNLNQGVQSMLEILT